jgi:hypothetical protein
MIHTVIFYHIKTKAQTTDLGKRILSTGDTTPNTWFTNFCFAPVYTHYAQGYPQKTGVFASKNRKNNKFFCQNPFFHRCYTQPVDKSCA